TVKVVGASSMGAEGTPVQSTANGGMHVNQRNAAGTEIAYNHGAPDAATIRTASQLGVGGAAVTPTNRVPTTDLLNLGYLTAEKTATNTATIARVGATNMVGRKVIEIINTGNVVIYVGSSTVTVSGATRGRPINPKGSYSIAFAENID